MSRDTTFTHLHLTHSRHADFKDEFQHPALAAPDLQIQAQHQPANPEDEDDVVPDQHAAFGIQRATQGRREVAWRDLGVDELMRSDGGLRDGNGNAGNAESAGQVNGDRTSASLRAALEGRERASVGSAGTGGRGGRGGGGGSITR